MNRWNPLECARLARPKTLASLLLAALTVAGAAPASAAEASMNYTVKPGDKLVVLARELLARPASWNEVARFNAMQNPDAIRPGQVLAIPLRLMKSSPAAGKLLSAAGNVQVDSAAAVVGSPIREGSRLQTGQDSSAVIELADGSRVQLLPGSVAELVTSREYAMSGAGANSAGKWFSGLFRLTQGAVETLANKLGKRATPLQVETPTLVVGVRGTHFRVAHEAGASRNSRAEVLEGLVRADNPTQQSRADLPMGTGAVINPAQKQIRVERLLPAPDLGTEPLNITTAEARTWAMPALPGASAFRVQVASDARFERIVRDMEVAGAAADLSDMPVGLWHVRVRGIAPQKLEGFDAVQTLTLREPPVRLQVTDSLLSFIRNETWLNWAGTLPGGQTVQAESYSAEVATDAQLTRIIGRPTSRSGPFNLGELKPGRYFIRLSAAGKPGAISETYRIEIPAGWGVSTIDVPSALQRAGQ